MSCISEGAKLPANVSYSLLCSDLSVTHYDTPDHHLHLPTPVPSSYAEVVPPPQQVLTPAPLSYADVVARSNPLSPCASLSYADVIARPRVQPIMEPNHKPLREARPATWTGPTTVNWWLTTGNRPICFADGYTGHVARYRNRVQPSSITSSARSRPTRPYYVPPSAMSPTYRPPPNTCHSPFPRRRLSPMRPRHVTREERERRNVS